MFATNDHKDTLDYITAAADGAGVLGSGATLLGGTIVAGAVTTVSTTLAVFLIPWSPADQLNALHIELEARAMANRETGSEANWETFRVVRNSMHSFAVGRACMYTYCQNLAGKINENSTGIWS